MNGPDKIRAAGWRQGSVIERQSAGKQLKSLIERTPPELAHWLVLTQDCDLVHGSYEKEPVVELLGCKIAATTDGNLTFGKNPRRIHLRATLGDIPATLDASVFHRFCFPRRALEEFGPLDGNRVAPDEIRTLIEWVARRYTRSAFPDEFNRRIRRVQPGFKKVLANNGAVISGVWLALSTYSELRPGEPYRIGVCATLTIADYADAAKRDQANVVVNALELGFADCEGIEVERSDFVSEADFPLSDLRNLARFDSYDYLSNTEEA